MGENDTIRATFNPKAILPHDCPICGQPVAAFGHELFFSVCGRKSSICHYYTCDDCKTPINIRHTDELAKLAWNEWVEKQMEVGKCD